jgi:hypothetical protein
MSFQPPSGSGAGSALILNDPWGFQEAQKTRASLLSLAARRVCLPLVLGGARSDLHEGTIATAFDHPNYWDVDIDWTQMAAGWTVRARVEVVTSDVTCSVKARIRNTTDAVDYDATTSVALTYTEKLITIPVPGVIGVKRYRLQLVPGLTAFGINALGAIEMFA